MASSDSGVESAAEVDLELKVKPLSINSTQPLLNPKKFIQASDSPMSRESPRERVDSIVCGDCHVSFPFSQFTTFIEHKVFLKTKIISYYFVQISHCGGKQTPSDEMIGSPPNYDRQSRRRNYNQAIFSKKNSIYEIFRFSSGYDLLLLIRCC